MSFLLKRFAVLSALFVVVRLEDAKIEGLSEATKKLFEELHKTCIKLTDLEEDVYQKFKKDEGEASDKLKCYVKCILNETAMMDDKGELDFGPVEAFLPKEVYEKSKGTIEECGKISDEKDLCAKAFNVYKCVHTKIPEITI